MKNLQQICVEFELPEERVYKFIQEEWVIPSDTEAVMFDHEDVARIGLIIELQEMLEVNDEAVPIILNLLDQIHSLRATVARLKR